MAANGGVGSHCIAKLVDRGGVESNRYYLSRKTVLEMLRDRGYEVLDSELDRSLTEFCSVFGDQPDLDRLRICAPLRSNPSKKILVIFMGTEPITVKTIGAIRSQIIHSEILHGLMLILQSKMNHFARKELELFSFKVETFQITDLLFNIAKHILQPKHEILTDEEKQKLLKKYDLENKQLPYIMERDAFARYYGLEKGQVIKFTYSGEIVGSLVTYRCVI